MNQRVQLEMRLWWASARRLSLGCLLVTIGPALLSVAGCRHIAPRASSSFEIVEPASLRRHAPSPRRRGAGQADPQDTVVPVEILGDGNPQPMLPPDAIAALGGRRSFDVLVTVDAAGHVTDVAPTPLGLLLPDPLAREVMEAIRSAVAQWRIQPARRIQYAWNSRGERQYVSSEPIPATVQLRFTFVVASARP